MNPGFIFLGISILSFSMMIIAFKEFERRGIPVLPAIFINYLAGALFSIAWQPELDPGLLAEKPGFLALGAFTGCLFLFNFLLMDKTVSGIGVGFTGIITKMSLILPVLISWLVFSEGLSLWNGLGILIAISAVVLINLPKKESPDIEKKPVNFMLMLVFPALLFLSTGFTDSSFKLFAEWFSGDFEAMQFGQLVFLAATVLSGGLVLLAKKRQPRENTRFTKGAWIGGVILGAGNFGSFLFMNLALLKLEGTVVFPFNHIGTVAVTFLAGLLFYKEKLRLTNAIGFLMAVASIFLLLM